MAQAIYDYYLSVLGPNFERTRRFDLHVLGLPQEDLVDLDQPFTEEEVWAVIVDLPNDKAPGPDGFTRLFYKRMWGTIKTDIMNTFNAFWSQDFRSFNHLNDAYMILLKKKEHPVEIKDYRPISLIHSFTKLITKCLDRLAGVLDKLVLHNQSMFIRGRCIHDNFRQVQLACRSIHARRSPVLLLKIDIAKAFDMVSWVFLLE